MRTSSKFICFPDQTSSNSQHSSSHFQPEQISNQPKLKTPVWACSLLSFIYQSMYMYCTAHNPESVQIVIILCYSRIKQCVAVEWRSQKRHTRCWEVQLSLFITFIRNETETEGISKIITLQVVAQFLHLDEHFRSTMCLVFSHCVFAPSRQPVSCWLLKVFHHNDFFRVTFTSVCCITTEKHTVTPLQRKRTVR